MFNGNQQKNWIEKLLLKSMTNAMAGAACTMFDELLFLKCTVNTRGSIGGSPIEVQPSVQEGRIWEPFDACLCSGRKLTLRCAI